MEKERKKMKKGKKGGRKKSPGFAGNIAHFLICGERCLSYGFVKVMVSYITNTFFHAHTHSIFFVHYRNLVPFENLPQLQNSSDTLAYNLITFVGKKNEKLIHFGFVKLLQKTLINNNLYTGVGLYSFREA